MRSVKTVLNITVIDFNSFVEEVNKTFESEIKKMFSVFVELTHKDRNKLYLYYTLRHVLKLHKKYGNKNVVFYVSEMKGDMAQCVYDKLINVSCAFPVMIYSGTYDFELLERNEGEATEISKDITHLRLNFKFENFTNRKIESFCKFNEINVFANVSDF